MKVLLISPFGKQLDGGIAKWTEHIMNYYNCSVSDVKLKLLYNSRMVDSFAGDSLYNRIMNGVKNYYPLYRDFKKTISKEHYDIVHICTSASLSLIKDLAIITAARKKGIKTVVHCHFGRIPQILSGSGLEHKLFIQMLDCVDQVVVMDMDSYRSLKQKGYEKVTYLPNPLANSVQKIIDDNVGIPRVKNKIVFVGHMVRGKGVFELVEACRQIESIQVEMLGHIADENIKIQLMTLAGENSESWLHIEGSKSFEEVIRTMLSSNLFVLPTYSEGFPNVIIESMACGCPIITTPVGAIPEMLNIASEYPCGICVEPKNVRDLKIAIEYMLNNPNLASDYGRRAIKRVREMYSIPMVWTQLVKIWEQTIIK